jgi:hypothetical protein
LRGWLEFPLSKFRLERGLFCQMNFGLEK